MRAFSLAGLLLVTAVVHVRADEPFQIQQNDVVTFLGGANMTRLVRSGHLETLLTARFVKERPRFRDLSWEADSVYRQGTVIERWRKDGFGSRADQLRRVGTTVAIAQFGQLESLDGRDGVERFRDAYERLLDELLKQARVVVIVSPTRFEKPSGPLIPDLSQRNSDLEAYVRVCAEIARRRKLPFVQIFHAQGRKLTLNGMHVRREAQSHLADQIFSRMGFELPSRKVVERLLPAVVEKQRLWYDYWRPANWKLLYGDDSRRVFTRGGKDYIPFREEWSKLLPMVAEAEKRIWRVADGNKDPGHARPKPEALHGDKNADVKAEIAAFSLSDGLKVNLFASEAQGLTSPLNVRWDPAGRMYVSVTTTYPHVFPGDVPNDKIIVLEDSDGDGVADRSSVFADGLNIPTGFELGDGGVYVGQNTEMLFLRDTDGDGKADERRVLLGGFGNGDSHQTINSFIWSPGGELFFGQGDGIESRVETPWGASNLFQAGFYRFRPRRLQLHPLLDDFMGPGNPWGVAFDEWGQIICVDGAGGVTHLSPGQVPVSRRLRLRRIGDPGGYCGVGYLDGRHLPEALQGDFLVGDFKANRLKRFSLEPDGAGFRLQWKEPLLRSRHRNFRPVDVKVGPDGAIYVVDWYNPITCHQDDKYRDPSRDKAHGRIWRITSDAPLVRPANLTTAPIGQVLDALKAPEHWTRYQAKRALTSRPAQQVVRELGNWVRKLDAKQPRYEHHLYEALGAYATMEVVEPRLLRRLLQAEDYRARAFAARIVGRWHDRLDAPLELLAPRVVDEHPLVRMEAVIACAAVPTPAAVVVASTVVDLPMDYWTTYAFRQAVQYLRPHWISAFKKGRVQFAKPSHLVAVLNEAGGKDVQVSLKRLLQDRRLTAQQQRPAVAAILAVGDGKDLFEYGLNAARFTVDGKYRAQEHAIALAELAKVVRHRKVRAEGDIKMALSSLIKHNNAQVQVQALTLAGLWSEKSLSSDVLEIVDRMKAPLSVRQAAFEAMVAMKVDDAEEKLATIIGSGQPLPIRSAAVQALVARNTRRAAVGASELLRVDDVAEVTPAALLASFLEVRDGAKILAEALQSKPLQRDNAREALRAMYSLGRSDRPLHGVLYRAMGTSVRPPAFSSKLINELVRDARTKGSVERGAVLFKTAACVSCHRIGGVGGKVGPNLSSIGTTLTPARIVEEILWPNRQVKEGYTLVQVLTHKGKILQGFERKTKQSAETGELVLEEVGSGRRVTLKPGEIEQKKASGSPMPAGLTAVLSRGQLLDLIRYVVDLGRL